MRNLEPFCVTLSFNSFSSEEKNMKWSQGEGEDKKKKKGGGGKKKNYAEGMVYSAELE